MSLSRRTFIARLASAVIGAAAVAHLPATVFTSSKPVRRFAHRGACERLRAIALAFTKQHGRHPERIEVGRDFFELFESELTACQRFVPASDFDGSWTVLMFKGARVASVGPGWTIGAVR